MEKQKSATSDNGCLKKYGKEKAVELVSDLAKKKYYQRDPDTKK